MSAIDDDEYTGPARLYIEAATIEVRVRLSGRFEPIDGRYHWSGRVAPHSDVEELVRAGRRRVSVQIGGRDAAPARLAEVDPWGGVRVVGTSRPPWAAPSQEGQP